MAKRSWFAAFLIFILCGCVAHTSPARLVDGGTCELQGITTILQEVGDDHAAGAKLLKRWDIPNDEVWESDSTPRSGPYDQYYHEAVRRAVETDPAKILLVNDTFNNRVVAGHLHDWIKPASCLEKTLIGQQHSRMNMFSEPSEFASFVLLSRDEKTIRVYYYTINRNGIGKASPLIAPVRQDVQSGWQPLFVLHNHPIVPGDPQLNGAPSPSVPDADFQSGSAKYLGLPEARITNGFHTVHMPAGSFKEFRLEGVEAP